MPASVQAITATSTTSYPQSAELAGFESFERPTIVRYPETPGYFDTEIKPHDQMGYR